MTNSFAEEAAICRKVAAELNGRPEHPFMLKLSSAFDQLAREQELKAATSKQVAREAALERPASV